MARTIYGAEIYESPTKETNGDGGKVLGKNSEVFHYGDPVTISNGLLQVAGTTDRIYGVALLDQTMTSSNQTVALVKPNVQAIDQDYTFLMGSNSDMVATFVGNFYQLTTATTGTVQVDTSSGAQTAAASQVVVCIAVDPLQEGGTGAGSGARQGLFRFVKTFQNT